MSIAVRITAYSSAVLAVLFFLLVQQQQCVQGAEDFPSDSSSAGDDFISYNQQTSFSTNDTPLEINFDNSDNYQQDVIDGVSDDDEIESKRDEKDDVVIVRKSYKDDDHDRIMYGDIIVKGYNENDDDDDDDVDVSDEGESWNQNQKQQEFIETTTTMATTTTTTKAPTTTTTTVSTTESIQDDSYESDEFRPRRNGSKSYKDWLTNRKRRVHSTFDKYKAYRRNYHRYGHRTHKKNFGKYKKYEHHRSKYKDSSIGSHHHHQRNHHLHHQKQQPQHHRRPHHQLSEHIAPISYSRQSASEPYYQGKVKYFGSNDDDYSLPSAIGNKDSSSDTAEAATDADKSFHLPAARMRSYQRYDQQQHYRRAGNGFSNGYRSLTDESRNRNVKWPHLRRIEYQITKDERQELLEDNDEDKLPPYIRKYNRRNKQLLDLLEGTKPPPSPPSSSSSPSSATMPTTISVTSPPILTEYSAPGIVKHYDDDDNDDDYSMTGIGFGKRDKSMHSRSNGGHSHYHNHKNPKWIMEDLFEEQRSNPNNPNVDEDQYLNDSILPPLSTVMLTNSQANDRQNGDTLKDFDDDSSSRSSIETNNNKSDDEHSKSIRANELPNSSVQQSSSSSLSSGNKNPLGFSKQQDSRNTTANRWKVVTVPSPITAEELRISPKANQFIYHRVASPRSVGTGTNIIGIDGGSRKQRLPFVAITDRRLETSKMLKSTDFQQNHMPLP